MQVLRAGLVATFLAWTSLMLSGCYAQDNDEVDFGSVSIGQQFIDLETAKQQGALTEEEYTKVREHLMQAIGIPEESEEAE